MDQISSCTGSVDDDGKIPLAERHGWVGLEGRRPTVAAGCSIHQSCQIQFKQVRGFWEIQLLSHGWMKLTETTQGASFQHQGGGTTRMQSCVVREATVRQLQLQGLHHPGENATGLEIVGRLRLAAGGPGGEASISADHATKNAGLADGLCGSAVGVANLENRATAL